MAHSHHAMFWLGTPDEFWQWAQRRVNSQDRERSVTLHAMTALGKGYIWGGKVIDAQLVDALGLKEVETRTLSPFKRTLHLVSSQESAT